MMDLTLDPRYATGDTEIPVPASIAVPSPVRNGRHVAADGGQCLLDGRVVVEVSANEYQLLLATIGVRGRTLTKCIPLPVLWSPMPFRFRMGLLGRPTAPVCLS